MTWLRTLVFLVLFPLTASALLGPAVAIGINDPRLGNGLDRLPSIATNGDQFFAVWEESRTPNVIRGARIAGDGTVLDPDGILITTDGQTPAVTWNGYAWAVTWYSGNIGYMAQLYDTNGHPLESPFQTSWSYEHTSILARGGDRIATLLHFSQVLLMTPELYGVKELPLASSYGYASLASDGNAFLFAGSTQTGLQLTRLDAGGNIIGTSTIAGHPATGPMQIVWSSNRYWIVWIDNSTVYSASVTADGVASSPVAIATIHDFGLSLSALPNGDAVAYVNATNTIAVDLATGNTTPIAMSLPELAMNARGDIIGVGTNGAIRIAHFRPDGTPSDDGQPLVRTPSSSNAPSGDPNGISPLVAFRVDRGSAHDLVVRDPNGGAPQTVGSSSALTIVGPVLGGNDTSTLAAWASCSATSTCTIEAALVAPDASPKPLHLATRNDLRGVRVAWTGSVYAVIWNELPTAGAQQPGLWMMRVSAAGDVLDASPVLVASAPAGNSMLHSAVTGDGVTLVSWDETFVACNCREGYSHTLRALRLDSNGNPIDSAPFTLSSFTGNHDLGFPAEAWDGIAFTVVWNRAGVVDGVRVLPSGFVSPFLTSTIQTTAPPMIAANGGQLFLAWSTTPNRVLTGTIDANGTVIDTGGIEAPLQPDWTLARPGGHGIVLLTTEVLPDRTTTVMLRTVDGGRPAVHRRSFE